MMEQLNETAKKYSEEIKAAEEQKLKEEGKEIKPPKRPEKTGPKGTDNFKAVIKDHLESIAANDSKFKERYELDSKSLDDCITYILNYVKDSKIMGYTDSEIFGLARHYYDEDNIKVGKPFDRGTVVVNRQIELTPEEKAEAKEKAIREVIEEEKSRIRGKNKKEELKGNLGEQASLF